MKKQIIIELKEVKNKGSMIGVKVKGEMSTLEVLGIIECAKLDIYKNLKLKANDPKE